MPSSTTLPARTDLPPLEDSDRFVRDEAQALSSQPGYEAWLQNGALVQRFVAAVENVADGDSPRMHVPFLGPEQPFTVRRDGARIVIDPASYARYDVIADAVASIDTSAAVRVYRTLAPLFDGAYRELGRPDRAFDATLRLALARLLAVQVPAESVELTPRVMTYAFADARLEALGAAEKHLLRMGPRNVRLVQAKLREIEVALDAQ